MTGMMTHSEVKNVALVLYTLPGAVRPADRAMALRAATSMLSDDEREALYGEISKRFKHGEILRVGPLEVEARVLSAAVAAGLLQPN